MLTDDRKTIPDYVVAAFAAAVIKQWKDDGEPKRCREAINAWQAVLEEAQRDVD